MKPFSRSLTNDPPPEPKTNPMDALANWVGKPLPLIIIFLFMIGMGMLLSARWMPPSEAESSVAASTPTKTPASLPAEAGTNTPSLPSPKPNTATPTPTKTLRFTATPTSTAVEYQQLNGSVIANQTACRYGPGNLYLYRTSLFWGTKLQALGRDQASDWLYVQADGFDFPCWVDVRSVRLPDLATVLEPYYPEKTLLPVSALDIMLQNVTASRDDSQVSIYWDAYLLPDGERESPQSPRYVAELWLCKEGELTFTILFPNQPNLLVTDEKGCSAPSSGVVYLAAKDGYAGPVEIPWP